MTSLPENSTTEPGETTKPPGNGDVEDRGEIGLEEVHRAERAEEDADADAVAQPEQAGHHDEIEGRLGQQQKHIRVFAHSGRPHPISPRKSVPKLHDGGYQQVDVNAENARISA